MMQLFQFDTLSILVIPLENVLNSKLIIRSVMCKFKR